MIAQTPHAINYQGVARNNGNVIANDTVALRLSVLADSSAGLPVYVETHTKVTNDFGLFTLQIGSGTPESGLSLVPFKDIGWNTNTFYLKVQVDTLGGTAWQLAGTSQFFSVPYALNAKYADSLSITGGTNSKYFRGDNTWQTLNTTAVAEGTNVYFTEQRVRYADLSGLSTKNVVIDSEDSVLTAFGKTQGQIDFLKGSSHAPLTLGATTNGLSLSAQVLSLDSATSNNSGALTKSDWNTFNGKESVLIDRKSVV